MCPVCTVGIVAGVGFSRWLGVSDTISGLWVGAAIFAFSWLTAEWLAKRAKEKSKALLFGLSFAGWWILTVLPLGWIGIISPLAPKIFGINDLLFGIIAGVGFAGIAASLEKRMRQMKNGKAVFPYQKVVIPISLLIIVSIILNFVI